MPKLKQLPTFDLPLNKREAKQAALDKIACDEREKERLLNYIVKQTGFNVIAINRCMHINPSAINEIKPHFQKNEDIPLNKKKCLGKQLFKAWGSA
jgi:hypothetical protein